MGGSASKGVYVPPTADELSVYDEKEAPFFVTEADAEMKIRLSKKGTAALKPMTVWENFAEARKKLGSSVALKWEDPAKDHAWQTWTWDEYYAETMATARSFVKLGMEPWTSVNIIGFNSPEWFFANMGAIAAGGKAAGIYTTNGPEACKYISDHSEANFVVCEDAKQLAKFLEIRDDLPHLKAIIMWSGDLPKEVAEEEDAKVPVYHWKDFIKLGSGDDEKELQEKVDERMAAQKPGHCCTLIYTSGTTGNPKAVMISHDNVTWTSRCFMNTLPPNASPGGEAIVSYLPLSHIAAQMLDIHAPISFAAQGTQTTVWFARPTALKGTLKTTLCAANPTFFFGVPRVWEKMQEALLAAGKARPDGLVKNLIGWAKGKGLANYQAAQVTGDGSAPFGIGIARKLLGKVRQALGLTRCRLCLTGAAPISKETLKYFGSLDIPIAELYGMSECTGPQNTSRFNYLQVGSCGTALPGTELKIDHDKDRDQPGEGEICYRGRHIMMGYLHNKEKSQGAIDDQGWLHSGDIGRVDENGLLYITGRLKELIITAGGENVAPVPMEDMVKAAAPAISNIMMVGDKRKYNVCLITLRQKPTDDGGFSDELVGASLEVDPDCKTVEEAAKSDKWAKYIQNGLDVANKNAVSRASKIQKFKILPVDFSVPGGELTSTLKLKRPVVMKKYADEIDALYA